MFWVTLDELVVGHIGMKKKKKKKKRKDTIDKLFTK
jgi:hypothetical protein